MIKTKLSSFIGDMFWTPLATNITLFKNSLKDTINGLFANNELGFAYDFNDLSTLYRDSDGNVPVTGLGQTIGLVLDKSMGLALGSEKITNGSFESGLIGTKVDANGSVSTWTLNTINPISGTRDGLLDITTAAASRPSLAFIGSNAVLNTVYRVSFDYKVNSGTALIPFAICYGTTININRTLTGSGTVSFLVSSTLANNACTLYFGNSICNIQIKNVSSKQILGNHAYQKTSSMRPLLQRNSATGTYYAMFDGVDDFLQTNTINLSTINSMSLCTGLEQSLSSSGGVVYEFSQSVDINNGAFSQTSAVISGLNWFSSSSRGTSVATANSNTSNIGSVILNKMQISTNTLSVLLNGNSYGTSMSQGTGNYGNYPLYIGRRAGASIPFKGNIYSLIGVGRLITDSEVIDLEHLVGNSVGATI